MAEESPTAWARKMSDEDLLTRMVASAGAELPQAVATEVLRRFTDLRFQLQRTGHNHTKLFCRIEQQITERRTAMTTCTPKGERWRHSRDVADMLETLRDGSDSEGEPYELARLRVVLEIAARLVSGMGGTFDHPRPDERNVLALEMAIRRYREGMPAHLIAQSEGECGLPPSVPK